MKTADHEPPGLHTFEPISLEYLLPRTSQNARFYTNGISRLIPRLTLKVHSDLDTCYELWNKYSQNSTIFDLWEYRYAWMKGYRYQHYFYTLYEGNTVLGTLPMWYNEDEKKYEWIGGYWMEGNNFFAEDDRVIDLMLSVVPLPIELMSINAHERERVNHMAADFKVEEDLKYTKDISGMRSMDDLLATYKKKHRYNLRYDYNKIVAAGATTEIVEYTGRNFFSEIKDMKLTRFDGKTRDLSVFDDKMQESAFCEALKSSGDYKAKFFRTSIGGELAAIDLIFTYRDCYYQMTGANDVMNYSGIGNYMVYVEIEDAIRNGFSTVDCLQEDHSWKHRYFDGREMYVFNKS